MARAIRYRVDIDRRTGAVLVGIPALLQALDVIWMTRTNLRVMLLDFGSNLRSWLAEDLTPALALQIYGDLASTAHRWEPEYRVREFQFVRMSQSGTLGLKHGGLYFPEGRFGNYDIAIPLNATPRNLGRYIPELAA
ncbi:MAG: integrase [Rhizobiaceae bacterium]|nr:integrase [Rhizobiaceae bacterium]